MFKYNPGEQAPKERSIWAYMVIGITALVGADILIDDRKFDIQN